MKNTWGVALVVVALSGCGSSSSSITGGGSSSNAVGGGSSTAYGSGSSGVASGSSSGTPSGPVDTCGCTATQECCLMIGGASNTFGCVAKGTCPSDQQPTPADAGTTPPPPPVDSGVTPPPPCTGTADCMGQQVCCTTGGAAAAACRNNCNGRIQVCADVNDCPQADSCMRVGGVMACVAPPPPPMDAGVDAARPADAGGADATSPDAGADAGIRDAAAGG